MNIQYIVKVITNQDKDYFYIIYKKDFIKAGLKLGYFWANWKLIITKILKIIQFNIKN